ncbi:hypothetical protein FOXYSP1_05054 [Fusarium oxysporum f. sp. phaseoli]
MKYLTFVIFAPSPKVSSLLAFLGTGMTSGLLSVCVRETDTERKKKGPSMMMMGYGATRTTTHPLTGANIGCHTPLHKTNPL